MVHCIFTNDPVLGRPFGRHGATEIFARVADTFEREPSGFCGRSSAMLAWSSKRQAVHQFFKSISSLPGLLVLVGTVPPLSDACSRISGDGAVSGAPT